MSLPFFECGISLTFYLDARTLFERVIMTLPLWERFPTPHGDTLLLTYWSKQGTATFPLMIVSALIKRHHSATINLDTLPPLPTPLPTDPPAHPVPSLWASTSQDLNPRIRIFNTPQLPTPQSFATTTNPYCAGASVSLTT